MHKNGHPSHGRLLYSAHRASAGSGSFRITSAVAVPSSVASEGNINGDGLRHDVCGERVRRREDAAQRLELEVLVVHHVIHGAVVDVGQLGRVEKVLLRLVEVLLELRPPASSHRAHLLI